MIVIIGKGGGLAVLYKKLIMEKILLALDALNLNTNTIDFGCYIARLTHSRLTGIFLEGLKEERPVFVATEEGTATVETNIHRFREACVCRETLSLVHRDRGVPLSEIIAESRFADLIIIDPETAFNRKDALFPGRFVKDVLRSVECPVLIAPYSGGDMDEIIFAYDGSPSSVFAIRQFAHLFPDLRSTPVTIVSIRDDEGPGIEEQFKMKEWLRAHFDTLHFDVRHGGGASDQLFAYLIERKNAIVVMGAYGRNEVSNFFRPSHANLLVKTVNLPIFIAHP
jgi:nucleotide-binding universal stress UspA family protein